MQPPELYVHQVRAPSEEGLYLNLIEPFLDERFGRQNPYQLTQIVQSDGADFAVYRVDHSVIGVEFFLDGELLTVGDGVSVQFIPLDEVRLIMELGEVSVDGVLYSIAGKAFHIIDGAVNCQRIIIFNLVKKEG